jgi:hypothetical protein
VQPRVVLVDPESAGEPIEPDELKMLADLLREEVVQALTKDGTYAVVEDSGPRAARIRADITDVVPISPGKNVGTSVAGAAVGVGLLVPRVELGRAATEVEISDSQTGERLVAVVAARKGKRFGGKIKGAKRWGDVRAAFKSWARELRKKLDEVHGE